VHERRVESWAELQEALFDDTWQESLGRFRSDFAYRGESRAKDDLTTSLMRLGGPYERLERHLLRNFRKYARRDSVLHDSIWDWLAVAKHHSLPTRLLDWSYSPYVALHFATAHQGHYGVDAAIWCVDYVRAKQFLPRRMHEILDAEGANTFTAELLEQAARSLDELDALEDEPFVVFFEPPSLDDRIVNQYALFSMMTSAAARLDEWLAEHDELVRRIVLPAELKWEVRDKLDQANITERVLFPGLDGLSAWLRRHYSQAAAPDDGEAALRRPRHRPIELDA
jgi:hypothetical protein